MSDETLNDRLPHRVPQLDGIRGMAILVVLIWHYYRGHFNGLPDTDLNEIQHFINPIFSLTWTGVDMFFVLSGFLIGGILMDNRDGDNYYKAFYVRRLCRIFPIYFLLLGLFITGYYFLSWRGHAGLEWLFNMNTHRGWQYPLLVQNFQMMKGDPGPNALDVTWFLSIEEQFYLLFPFFIRMIPVKRIPCMLILLILFAPLFRMFFYSFSGMAYGAFYMLPSRMDSLLMGACGACLIRQPGALRFLRGDRSWFLHSLFVVLGLGLIFFSLPSFGLGSPWMLGLGHTWISAFYLSFLLIAVSGSWRPLQRLVTFRPLMGLGVISYAVYLYHKVVNGVCHAWFLNQRPSLNQPVDYYVTFLALILTLFISLLSWHFFEKPILSLGRAVKFHR